MQIKPFCVKISYLLFYDYIRLCCLIPEAKGFHIDKDKSGYLCLVPLNNGKVG